MSSLRRPPWPHADCPKHYCANRLSISVRLVTPKRIKGCRRQLSPLLGHLLGLAKRTQEIAAQDFQNVLSLVSAIEQLLRDVRVTGHVFELLWNRADTVKIGAEPDVIHTGHFDDVFDVVDDV